MRQGETVILFGPNGVGKSSLFMAIMGFPKYKIIKGEIYFRGKNITELPTSDRAKLGIGMSFQRPPSIKGVKLRQLGELIRTEIGNNNESINKYVKELRLEKLIDRDINLGYSGGEVKRAEIFQLLLQNPLLSLIDEPESGVDIENISVLGNAIKELLHKEDKLIKRKNSGIIITHTGFILNYLNADTGYMLINGTLTCSGNPREIFELIQQKGYTECMNCLKKSVN